MPLFAYRARDAHGLAVEGTQEAPSAGVVADRLMEGGLTPVVIRPVEAHARATGTLPWPKPRVTALERIQFSRQMHSLLRAGVPLLNALRGLEATVSHPAMKAALRRTLAALEAGQDLATALAASPDVFDDFYVSLVRVGETTGRLDEVFRQLAFYLEREKRTRDRLRAVVRYPVLVLVAVAVALLIINLKVVPAFAGVYAHFGAALPLPTRIVVAFSEFTRNHIGLLAAGFVLAVMVFRLWVATDVGRLRWDRWKLCIPFVGPLMYKALMARFTRLFAMAHQAGVPLIGGLGVIAHAVGNRFMEERILAMRTGLERGDSITNTAAATGLFDPLVMQMIAVGEEAGTLDELLAEVARHYDDEVDYGIERLNTTLEPLLTLLVAIVVGLLAVAVFLPMWNLVDVVLRH